MAHLSVFHSSQWQLDLDRLVSASATGPGSRESVAISTEMTVPESITSAVAANGAVSQLSTGSAARQEERNGHEKVNMNVDTTSSQIPRFVCTVCQRAFGRVEHLTRHSRIHQKERSLKCAICQKGFYRIDALRRHEQIHQSSQRSSLPKGSRACAACAAGRRKCSGTIPCSCCEKRDIICEYLAPKRRRTARATASSDGESGSSQNEVLEAVPADRVQDYNSQDIQHPEAQPSWNTTAQMTGRGFSHVEISPEASNPLGSAMVRVGIGIDPMAAPPEHISPTTMTSEQSLLVPAAIPEDVQPISRDDFWYQGNLSSINWLSDPYIPGYQTPPEQSLMMIDQTVNRDILAPADRTFSNVAYIDLPSRMPLEGAGVQATMSAVAEQDVQSPEPTSHQETGQYYVDGNGARLPRIRTRKRRGSFRSSDAHTTPSAHLDGQSHDSLQFPDRETMETLDSLPQILQISQGTYNEIRQRFEFTCRSTSIIPIFESSSFPSRHCISYFLHLYQENYRSNLPFTHPAPFDSSNGPWLLILAMASIGCHYAEIEGSALYISAMSEFLHRAIDSALYPTEPGDQDLLVYTQAKILSCVCIIYSGEDRLHRVVSRYRNDLAFFCETEWMSWEKSSINQHNSNADYQWKNWIKQESLKRTGYAIWLLDCMWAFHTRMRPRLSLEDAKIPMPCQESLWDAENLEDWLRLYPSAAETPSLQTAIQLLYVEKHLPRATSEFSRILLIHGLFRRSWEVESYYQQPLSQWTPTASKQSLSEVLNPSKTTWLPGIPTYSKWRNSTCDCLDILHWQANSTIAAAAGMEHPTVLHLHLARVILLTPFRSIMSFAMALADDTGNSDAQTSYSSSTIATDRSLVHRWATEDQYKARLAMIHAGVVFWHIRRYSVDGFYEPHSVFLATLALWVYGLFAKPTSIDRSFDANSELPGSDSESEAFPTAMQLDRPADDELVQLFVKRGASMQANLMGVGNLCCRKGPKRVLIEGRKLILRLKSWGIGRKYLGTLSRLIDRMDIMGDTIYMFSGTTPAPIPERHEPDSR